MRYSPGQEAVLQATFTNSQNQLVDPDSINVDIRDSNGIKWVEDGTPERISVGQYVYRHMLPEDAVLGLWRVEWQAIIQGLSSFGQEFFEVEISDINVNPVENIYHLRLRDRLGEKSLYDQSDPEYGNDTLFSITDIIDLLNYSGGNMEVATLEGWRHKAAHFAAYIDINENGSDRKMSQKYKAAMQQVEYWGNQVFMDEADVGAYRAVGVSIDVYGTRPEYGATWIYGAQRLIPPYALHYYPRLLSNALN